MKVFDTRKMTFVVAVLGALTMAPTAGDVGGCGHEATLLDPAIFGAARKEEDCERCKECGVETTRCKSACNPSAAPDIVLPPTCRPLLHDGEVCLRAIAAASCDDFASYVDDVAPTTPSECEFCRVAPPPEGSLSDGAAP